MKKEDRGMVPGGSDLSDAEDRGMVPGGVMVTGEVCSMYLRHYIKVISLVQKGRDYSEEYQRHSDRGRIPKESSSKGSSPKMRMALFH